MRRTLLVSALILASAPAARAADAIRLELEAPAPGAIVELTLPWALAQGWAAVGPRVDQDLVIALDLSDSTEEPSGADVDGDGQRSGARDSVRAAEIAAARALIDGLDFARTRAALLVFADNAWTLCPLTDKPEALRERLTEIEQEWSDAGGATDIAKALRRAARLLGEATAAGDTPRRRDVVLLSDGEPTAPGSRSEAQAEALAAAAELAREGVRVQAFALGGEPREGRGTYARLAERTNGRFVQLETPGDVLRHLPQIDLAGVSGVEVVNATSGAPSRATHRGADGSFEAFVPLVPGENRIRVVARGRSGEQASLERTIAYAPRPARDATDAAWQRRQGDALLQRLQRRSAQLALLREMQDARETEQRRTLDLTPEDARPAR